MNYPKNIYQQKTDKKCGKKKILNKVDKELDFSEVYVVGSMISNKKNPEDIDFAIITKVMSALIRF